MAIKAPITGRAGTNLTVAIHYWPQLDKANADDDIYHQPIVLDISAANWSNFSLLSSMCYNNNYVRDYKLERMSARAI